MNEPRLIKKYKNRRLYDTELSQYITIETLQQYVMQRLIFRVEDSVTGQDITNATLLQILVELEPATPLLSADFLRQLIILAEHPMSQAMKNMMPQMMAFLEKQLANQSVLTEYQRASEQWLKHWQEFFK